VSLLPPATGRADTFVFNTSYSAPYSTQDHDGILDRILREALSRLGYEVEFRNLPAERALVDADAGTADGIVARIKGMDAMYRNLVRVESATIPSRDFVAFSGPEVPSITSWRDLTPYNITFVRGWKLIETSVPPAKSVVPVDSTERAFSLLAHGRVDVVISARLDGRVMAAQFGLTDIKVHEPPLASLSLYPYIHEKHRDLAPVLGGTLEAMKREGTFARIYNEAMSGINVR
jgi:polar amino acid transport system substrate-binding protein